MIVQTAFEVADLENLGRSKVVTIPFQVAENDTQPYGHQYHVDWVQYEVWHESRLDLPIHVIYQATAWDELGLVDNARIEDRVGENLTVSFRGLLKIESMGRDIRREFRWAGVTASALDEETPVPLRPPSGSLWCLALVPASTAHGPKKLVYRVRYGAPHTLIQEGKIPWWAENRVYVVPGTAAAVLDPFGGKLRIFQGRGR